MKKIIMALFSVLFLISCNVNNPESEPKYNDLCYSLNKSTHTAFVCREKRDSTNYSNLGSHIILPDSIVIDNITYIVVGIEDYAFNYCTAIEVVEIPESVTHIGYGAFSECKNLRKITASDSTTYIGGKAFDRCQKLEEFKIPKKVNEIKVRTFANCTSLKQIEIHESVISIEKFAFTSCDSLQLVINHAKDPQEYDSIFFGTNISKATLKVPDASIEKYKDAKGWMSFGIIISI